MVHRRCSVIGKGWLGRLSRSVFASFMKYQILAKETLRTLDFHKFWEVEALFAGVRAVFLVLEVRLWNYRYAFDLGYIRTAARPTVCLLKPRGGGNG